MNPIFYAQQTIESLIPQPQSTLLEGILLGIPIPYHSVLASQLQKVGLTHLVVLSGMNISLMASFLLLIAPYIGRKKGILLTAFILIIFVYLVTFQAPIARAIAMQLLTFVGIMFGKRALPLVSLLISSLVILLIWPDWISQISFQLSFAATLGILLFAHQSYQNLFEQKIQNNSGISFIKDELRITLAAQILTTPLIMFYFGQISFISPLTNILVGWTMPIIIVLGFATIFFSGVYFPLGTVPSFILYGLLSYVSMVITYFSQLPFIFLSL